jgi:hypothetical protein
MMDLVPVNQQIGRLLFIRQLDGFRGVAALVKDVVTKQHHVISAVMLPAIFALAGESGPEIMIFPCDENGKVTDWGEEACWREFLPLDEVMSQFSEMLESGEVE